MVTQTLKLGLLLLTAAAALGGCQRSARPFGSGSSFSSPISHKDSDNAGEGTEEEKPSSKTDGEGVQGFWIDKPRVAVTHKDPGFWNVLIGSQTISARGPGNIVRLLTYAADPDALKSLDFAHLPITLSAKFLARKSVDLNAATEFQVPFDASKRLLLFLGSQGEGPDILNVSSADELYTGPETERDAGAASPLPTSTPTVTPTPLPVRNWGQSIFELYKADVGKHLFSLSNNEGVSVGFALVARRFGTMSTTNAITCSTDNHISIRRASKVLGAFQSFNYDTWDGGHRRRINEEGWTNDSPTGLFDCLCKQEPGTVPLYKYLGPNEDNYLTLTLQTIAGYPYVGPLCFVHP